MGFLSNLFSGNGEKINEEAEHAVIVHFMYGFTNLQPIFELEEKLEKAISSAKVGDYDGHDIATNGSDGFLYMYGSNADILFDTIFPILKNVSFMKGAKVIKRYGPPEDGVKEVETLI